MKLEAPNNPQSTSALSAVGSKHRISGDQVAEYNAKGYIVVKGRFDSGEVEEWKRETDRVWAIPGLLDQKGWRVQYRTQVSGGRAVERLEWASQESELFARLQRDPRIVEPVEQLTGGPAQCFKDKLLVRAPDSCGYKLHQDFPNWDGMRIPPQQLLSVGVAVNRVDISSGALTLFPGYQGSQLSAPPDDPVGTDPNEVDPSRGETIELEAGDLLLFHVLTPHCSDPNRSKRRRRMLYYTFAPISLGDDLYERYYRLKIDCDSP
jgi:ectoine hydroxylase-related dioxygenase (phytanoyl-CoA dioxygenase family)